MAGKRIKGITIEIDGNTTKLQTALKGVDSQLSKTQSSLRDVNRLLKLDPHNTELLSQKQKLLGQSIKETKERLDTLKKAQEQAKEALENGDMGQDKYDALQREIVETEQKLKSLESAAEKNNNKLVQFGEKAQAAGEKISGVGKKLMPVSAAAGAVGVASSKMALDFEDSMANINTLLADTKNLDGYKNAVKDLSNETGIDLQTAADGMYQAISSLGDGGKDTEQIFKTMGIAAKAGGAEVSDSVSLISAGMKGYNSVSAETAQKISDLAFETAKLGVTTFPEMAKSMQPLFPLASSLNISYEELFGSMATLTGVTGNTAEVSTQLKAVFSNLMKPTKDMAALISDYGYESGAALLEAEGMPGFLKILQKETGGESSELAKLFSSTEALTGVTALTGSQFDAFNEKLGEMQNATGATQTAYDKLATNGDTVRVSINKVKNTGVELGTTLIQILAPAISKAADLVSKLSEWFNGLSDSQKKVVGVITLILTVVGPLLLVIGTVITKVGDLAIKIGPLITKLRGIHKAGKLAGLGAKLFSAKLIPIIAIVAAVVAAGVLLYKNWDKIKATAKKLATGVKTQWGNLKTATKEKWSSIKNTVSEKWNGIKSKSSETAKNVKNTVSTAWGSLKNRTSEKWGDIKSTISSKWSSIKSSARGSASSVKNTVSGAWSSLKSTTSSKWSSIKNTISDKISGAKEKVREQIDKIKSFFNFHWSLPSLKLPHITITGKFGIKPPSAPHFSLKWYKKAMDSAYMLNGATIFGSMNGSLLGGGEAGSEMIVGQQHLINMLQKATANSNSALITAYMAGNNRVVDRLDRYLPMIANQDIRLDSGELVGAITPGVNVELGRLKARERMGF